MPSESLDPISKPIIDNSMPVMHCLNCPKNVLDFVAQQLTCLTIDQKNSGSNPVVIFERKNFFFTSVASIKQFKIFFFKVIKVT